ncbi:MAG TPA: GDSL-type esterase/lipase family protein [Pirellulales bacterium]|jgi:acyl-CoA thioesterase-1|nr:GDSL-type esterase/lipase family protein [Pirellulales bacterium]
MSWVVYLFGSGTAFFLGIGLLLISLAAFCCCQRPVPKIICSISSVVGCLFIVVSATPLPYWLYFVAATATILWLVAERSAHRWISARRTSLRVVAAIIWSVMAALELPFQFTPTISAANRPTLYIIGDSVAAGMSDSGKGTWPRLLASSHSAPVVDLSKMGATASLAMQQADGVPPAGGMVLLEIGGNDLLGTTSASKFEKDLGRLLGRVCCPGRVVLMFELPLPPFCNEFGRVQRRLAAEYGVRLIPKRIFMKVLTGSGNTLDSIHLSAQGHEKMADEVWKIIRPAYRHEIGNPTP